MKSLSPRVCAEKITGNRLTLQPPGLVDKKWGKQKINQKP